MVLKNISPGCGVRASLMLFFNLCQTFPIKTPKCLLGPDPMDRQGPPNQPSYQITRGLNRTRQRKKYYDVRLSRQEGSTMCHLANGHSVPSPAGSISETLVTTSVKFNLGSLLQGQVGSSY